MTTKEFFTNSEELKQMMSAARATITAPFFGNNVEEIKTVSEAYKLARTSPGTVELTGMPVYKPEKLGLPQGANQLLFNDGTVVGRCAAARKIVGEPNCDLKYLLPIIREAIYKTRDKLMYRTEVVVGLDKDYMVKAHLLIPEGFENIMYSWMLNFQYINEAYANMYADSKPYPEGDIFVFSDPDWTHPDFPYGLTFFDPEHNCACILGMRYFGEHKKGTLTLAWGCAARNGFASCHGGMKRYNLENGKSYTIGVFGLSGSGKSTLTHEKHDGRYDISILHDDAYIINTNDLSSIALEPTYFDKMQDYPVEHPANEFLLTLQNVGVTMDEEGRKVVLAEDVRNNNGRAIKSQFWTDNRVNYVDQPVNAIVWLMKDKTLPPILKINDPVLASTMGAALATRRSTAEKLDAHVDPNALVIEPYANPFRTYPLVRDYESYKKLFSECGVQCYIMNTGFFLEKKIPKEVTLDLLERLVEGTLDFKPFYKYENLSYVEVPGFEPPFQVREYHHQLHKAFEFRYDYVEKLIGHKNELPQEVLDVLKTLM